MSALRRRLFCGVFVAASCLVPAAAQVELPRFSEAVEVRVTNLDVVVTDEKGQRVHGLTRDDFEVWDQGKRQQITNFSETIAETPPIANAESPSPAVPPPPAASLPPRRLVLFFDNLSTTREERRRMLPALTQLIRELGPNDEAMIVSWNRLLRVHVPPTSDRARLEEGLTRAASELSLRSERLTMFSDLTGGAPNAPGGGSSSAARQAERTLEARRQIREATADLNESIRGLKGILMRLSGLDGRKALVLISSGFSFRPGAGSADAGEEEALRNLEGVRAPQMLKVLADAANAAGVTIYSLHAQGLQSGMSAASRGEDVASGSFMDASALFQSMRASGGSIDGLTYLSASTGGLIAANTNTFAKAISKIAEDLRSYYSIGYRASDAPRDVNRAIEVRTRNKHYTVRARASLIERSSEDEISDRVMSAVLFPSASANTLEISARVLRIDGKGRNRIKVPVDVRIPMARLTLQSDSTGALRADLSIFIATADLTGSVSKVQQFRQLVPITRAQLPTLATRHYTYGLDVDLRTASAENRFAIGVMDNISKEWSVVALDVKP